MNAAQIVLVEDNSADVLLVEMALKENGISYELTRFKDGQDAVDALCSPTGPPQNPIEPDAILLDLNTPRSDGFAVLGKLRLNPRLSHVPIAIITSSQAASDKHRTGIMSDVRCIEKPSQLAEFLDTVGKAVKEMLHV